MEETLLPLNSLVDCAVSEGTLPRVPLSCPSFPINKPYQNRFCCDPN